MAESRTLNIGYPPFKLAFEVEAYANVDTLSVCGWCSAIVVDQDRHTRMHSCGCSGLFRLKYASSGGHEIGVCPLAKTTDPAAPQEWPPRVDDLWRHDEGALWFGTANGSNVVLVNSTSHTLEPQAAWEQRTRLTLVHREDES